MTLPYGKFFWSDYASDPALKLCSFAAQGLWMRMLCLAAEHDPVGYVAVNNRPLDCVSIARATGGERDEVERLLDELDGHGVFSRDRRGCIYSRRMIRDAKKRDIAAQNGKKGGNPKLRNYDGNSGLDNQKLKGEDKGRPNPQSPESRVQIKNEPKGSQKKVIPDDWQPGEFGTVTECRRIVDGWSSAELRMQVERFRAHHERDGSKFANWQAAWKTWVLNSVDFVRPQRRDERSSHDFDLVEQINANPERWRGSG